MRAGFVRGFLFTRIFYEVGYVCTFNKKIQRINLERFWRLVFENYRRCSRCTRSVGIDNGWRSLFFGALDGSTVMKYIFSYSVPDPRPCDYRFGS